MTSFDEIGAKMEQLYADMAHRDDLARDVARLWTAEGERWEISNGDLLAALDRLASVYGAQPEEQP